MSHNKADYRVIGPKGEGFFCYVWKVERNSDGNMFALKELKPEHLENKDYKRRFKKEVECTNDLQDCEQVIEIIDYCVSDADNEYWYVMPLADRNLEDYINANNQLLEESDRYSIIRSVFSAISFAHDKNILHRDISPRNVLVYNNGQPSLCFKLSDFGLGKDTKSLTRLTRSNASGYGTPYYVAPEQLKDLNSATAKSDIYSLGKLMYFILTGRIPRDLIYINFSNIISKCTEVEPAYRYSDMTELSTHFENMIGVMQECSFPIDQTTITDYLKNVKNQDFTWSHFHEIAKRGLYYGHPFEYIETIVGFFNINDRHISEYYKIVGADFIVFIREFISVLDALNRRLRWPFSYNKDIGVFLARVYTRVSDLAVKIECLKRLWLLGFVYDQWNVQNSLLSLLTKDVPEEILPEFLVKIRETPRVLDIEKISSSPIAQFQIRQAMIACHDDGKRQEEERKLKDKEELLNFP